MAWNKVMPAHPVVAVAGATGVVGREMLKVLAQREFPATKVKALASARSAGSTVEFGDGELVVEEMTPASLPAEATPPRNIARPWWMRDVS